MSKSKHDPVDVHVGGRLRQARLMAEMSQEKVADRVQLTFQQIQKYEKGSNRIGPRKLVEFGEIFNRPISWFFAGIERCNDAAPPADPVNAMIGSNREGQALATAFVAIKSEGVRRALVGVAQAVAQQ